MLPIVRSPGALLTVARLEAGLSMHALAARAQVAYTTVSRIEHGQVDPTTGMLQRLLAATGMQLEFSTKADAIPQLADLVDAWKVEQGSAPPNRTRLRAFLDMLAQRPELAGPATIRMPAPSGSALMDNLLASIAEKVADDAGIPRPPWTKRIPKLAERWVSSGTPRMRAEAEATTPEPLARRGITLRADSLWRDPTTVGR
jgi:transcriptional regulator with XRE-family HTH domain